MTNEPYIAEINIKAKARFDLIMANSENAVKALWEVCALIKPLDPDRLVDKYLAEFPRAEDAVREACFCVTFEEWQRGRSEDNALPKIIDNKD